VDPITLAAALVSLLTAALVPGFRDLLSKFRWTRPILTRLEQLGLLTETREPAGAYESTYAERMQKLSGKLHEASSDFETLLQEMDHVAKQREIAVTELETKLTELSEREQTLESRITTLSQTHPRVAQEFIALLEEGQKEGEKRSARRDYMLFAAGVVVTIVLTLVFNALGFGS
jgi:chromosome segregation ATPase